MHTALDSPIIQMAQHDTIYAYGKVDRRRAAVEAGMGVYGLNNLLVTDKYGPRVRSATVLTPPAIAQGRETEGREYEPGSDGRAKGGATDRP